MPHQNASEFEQGTFLMPDRHNNHYGQRYDGEMVVDAVNQFATHAPDPQAATEEGLFMNVDGRNAQVMRAIGQLGVLAETAPAARMYEDETARIALKHRFGEDYELKAETMRTTNEKVQAEFDEHFERMWGLDQVKASGLMSDEDIRAKLTEDKAHFTGNFSQSIKTPTVDEASYNRRKYRSHLRRQQRIYTKNRLGDWPKPRGKRS